jgi:acyl phosphate:glycerol-3-phosphate acyltransferase
MRSVGRSAGLAAFVLDFLKGSAATWLALRLAGPTVAAVAAVVAVLGHMYPVWLSFKGGKGVATGAGAFLPIIPIPAIAGLLTFAVVAGLTRYASIGSVAGASALPIVALLTHAPPASSWAAAVAAFLIIWKHRGNLRRIAAGTERRLGSRAAGAP